MEKLIRQIRWLMRAIFLFMFMLVAYTGVILYVAFNPPATQQEAVPLVAGIWQPKNPLTDLPDGEEGELVQLGHDLILNTSRLIGPLSQDPDKRFAGNNLNCGNCHLDAGRKIGSGSFIGVANRFPQFRGRENKIGTLEERINGCMERSMNGQVLPDDSKEMQSMIAYMKWLSEGVPEDMEKMYKGYKPVNLPAAAADTSLGRLVYEEKCMICHGPSGEGQRIPGEVFAGYVYPPVGGKDTYNDGAGMNRVITAAEFIKANMPFGATYDTPLLTDEEAYHVAAYINTFDRPAKPNKEKDFPDILLKPVSTPYGPWADSFPPEQHKFGPFQPIMEFYEKEHGISKSK